MIKSPQIYGYIASILKTSLILAPFLSVLIILTGFGLAIYFIAQKHWLAFMKAECTRGKKTQRISMDVIGPLLGMVALIFTGGISDQNTSQAVVGTGSWVLSRFFDGPGCEVSVWAINPGSIGFRWVALAHTSTPVQANPPWEQGGNK